MQTDLTRELRNILNGKTLVAETATKLASEQTIKERAKSMGFNAQQVINILSGVVWKLASKGNPDRFTNEDLSTEIFLEFNESLMEFIKNNTAIVSKESREWYLTFLLSAKLSAELEYEAFKSKVNSLSLPADAVEKAKLVMDDATAKYQTAICKRKSCKKEGKLTVGKSGGKYYLVVTHPHPRKPGRVLIHQQQELTEAEYLKKAEEFGAHIWARSKRKPVESPPQPPEQQQHNGAEAS